MHLTSLIGTDNARIQKVLTEGGLLMTMFLFLVVESREDPNITISGPSKRQFIFFLLFFRGGGGWLRG